jgi:hypothetical protein
MKLTLDVKQYIDSLSYGQLLSRWRFSPVGDPYFQGETGEYWSVRMNKLRKEQGDEVHIRASKTIGWDR